MQVLVTGGAGFIGSHMVDRLVEEGAEVVVVDNLSRGCHDNINKKAKFYNLDISHPSFLDWIKDLRFDCVFHLAAQTNVMNSIMDPYKDAAVNILGSINVLKGCVLAGVRKIIYSSSAAVYGNPCTLPIKEDHPLNANSGYGISKKASEVYFEFFNQNYGIDYTILRYANVYGPRQCSTGEGGVIGVFLRQMLDGVPPVIFGDGLQTRDFIYVEDVCEANLAAVNNGSCSVFNISSGISTSIKDLFDIIAGLCRFSLPPEYKEARPGDIHHSVLDNSKAREHLNWKASTTLLEGLQRTLTYIQEQEISV
ncbi:MAG TPA: NAD-dependent epimerase/dehydratase family protein [Bacillota bacterium]|nr:NAD-dependent epimerase/dehydratase family protein [Bacillota bacterium]HPZ89892.1 NAD-dependent epimerase/dehydratase family protein [Bacillota bacterium]HQE01297.1 NAD-dependent epimerase/dehydratase family protein [Bacillota bacterium]